MDVFNFSNVLRVFTVLLAGEQNLAIKYFDPGDIDKRSYQTNGGAVNTLLHDSGKGFYARELDKGNLIRRPFCIRLQASVMALFYSEFFKVVSVPSTSKYLTPHSYVFHLINLNHNTKQPHSWKRILFPRGPISA